MSLLAMQRDMRAWLTREDEGAAARLGAGVAPGLRVHLNNYRSQLIACLAESFACTLDWIGGEAFEAAAAIHIDRIPPSSWTLDAYPRDFPETLGALHRSDPEVAELAWLEYALGEAFVGPDAPALSPADIASIDWDRVTLGFTPTLDIAALTTNAPAIWSALTGGEVPPAAEVLSESGAMLVWRQRQLSRFRAIGQIERQALLHARAGMPFAAMCHAIAASLGEDEGVAQAGHFLGQWMGDGLIATTTIASD